MHALRSRGPSWVSRLAALCALLLTAFVASFGAASASAATGPYAVKWSEPGDLENHTVYQPTKLPAGQLPILVWGEGACFANGLLYQAFLTEIASHGIVVIASGGPGQVGGTNVGMMERSIDWAKARNAKVGDGWFGKLDATHVVVAGHSCGGLEAYQLANKRSEVAAVGIMNSGQLTVSQAQLDLIKVPIMYVLGGKDDVAYSNGVRDLNHLDPALPAFLASTNTGHLGTYFNANGGSYAQVLTKWILWRIEGDATAGASFTGTPCGLCGTPGWTVQRHNIS